jgi:hypothetical protein
MEISIMEAEEQLTKFEADVKTELAELDMAKALKVAAQEKKRGNIMRLIKQTTAGSVPAVSERSLGRIRLVKRPLTKACKLLESLKRAKCGDRSKSSKSGCIGLDSPSHGAAMKLFGRPSEQNLARGLPKTKRQGHGSGKHSKSHPTFLQSRLFPKKPPL